MRRLFVCAFLLLLSCRGEQPSERTTEVPVRTIEVRLTREVAWAPCRTLLRKGHVIAEADCGPRHNEPPAVSVAGEACDDMTSTHAAALDTLLTLPQCTDAAIAALERLGAPATDLSAAYYVRAQRQDRPSDLLRALEAAERAMTKEGHRVEARFNRAVILEQLGLTEDAAQAFDEIGRLEKTPWGAEAHRRRSRLRGEIANWAEARWNAALETLLGAAKRGDRAKVAELIRPFPAATYALVEKDPEVPGMALIAAEYAKLTGDRYLIDLVARPSIEAVVAKFAAVTDFEERGYTTAAGLFEARIAYGLTWDSRYVDALERYDAARVHFVELKDRERVAHVLILRASVLRVLGEYDLALREIAEARRFMPEVVASKVRHLFYGDTAQIARDMGYLSAALLFQNAALRVPKTDGEQSIAFRQRAIIHVRRGDREAAKRDLAVAVQLDDKNANPADRRALDARMAEVQAQIAENPETAVAEFTRALALSETTEYRTFRTHLYLQRAAAHVRAGDKTEAERDRIQALNVLREEEQGLLASRKIGQGEELWRPYFSRFTDVYRQVIATLVEIGRADEAFAYAERAKAFEPLNLLLQLPHVPPAFREMAAEVTPRNLARIQQELPVGTFLIEYAILGDSTCVWIVSHDRVEQQRLPIGEKQIERWTAAVHEAARLRNQQAFEAALADAHLLVAEPLNAIAKMPHGRDAARRVVFVPDGAIHGLPLAALKNPVTKRYVIEDQPVSIAGSATLYALSLDRNRKIAPSAAPFALLIANPLFTQELELTQGMQRLPMARAEVESIAPLYAPAARILVDEAATVAEFLALARESSVVHFAGHAIARPRAPHQSLLLFAETADDNGVLDAETLLAKLHLNRCRLVVLSACSTAGGSPIGAEGLAPLVRPILAAGAPAVVGSLWNVGDESAAKLLVPFHQHYRTGLDADRALQKAQLAFIKNKQSALAWAPFQVIGHASSPFAPRAAH